MKLKFVTFEYGLPQDHMFSPKSSFHWPLGFMMMKVLSRVQGKERMQTLLFHFSRSLFLSIATPGSLCVILPFLALI